MFRMKSFSFSTMLMMTATSRHARLLDRVTDLGVVVSLAVIEGLDLFHVGLELLGIYGLPVPDGHDPLDFIPFEGVVPLDPDLRDHGFFHDGEGDHLPFGYVGHFRRDVIEISHPVDGLDVGRKIRIGKDTPRGAFQDLIDGAAFDLAVALEFDPHDPLLGGYPAHDVHPEPGENGAEVLTALALNEDPRQDLPLAYIDQPDIHADLVAERGDAARDGIGGAGLSAHLEHQGIVQPLTRRGGGDRFPLDEADALRFQKFRGDALVDRFPELGVALRCAAVDFKRKERDFLDVFCRCSPGRPEENDDQQHRDACKKQLSIHRYKSFRRADRFAGTSGRPVTGCA